jgi:DNA-binding protein WhiA
MGINKLAPKLAQVARARLKHPEVSLKELGELVEGGPISKSGVNHRLRKINEFASKLAEDQIA